MVETRQLCRGRVESSKRSGTSGSLLPKSWCALMWGRLGVHFALGTYPDTMYLALSAYFMDVYCCQPIYNHATGYRLLRG